VSGAVESEKGLEARQKDLQARATSAGSFALIFTVIFAALAVPGFLGVFPKTVAVLVVVVAVVGGAAGSIRAWRFNVEASRIGRKLTELQDRLQNAGLRRDAPVFDLARVDPTEIGVDRAAQDILPGGGLPEYVPREIDNELREALAAAIDGSGAWLVVVEGHRRSVSPARCSRR
jgi:hypothetical protein